MTAEGGNFSPVITPFLTQYYLLYIRPVAPSQIESPTPRACPAGSRTGQAAAFSPCARKSYSDLLTAFNTVRTILRVQDVDGAPKWLKMGLSGQGASESIIIRGFYGDRASPPAPIPRGSCRRSEALPARGRRE